MITLIAKDKKKLDMKKLTYVFYLLLVFAVVSCKQNPKTCITYKYRISVCNNCFGAWFYTNSIDWENGMLIAKDEYGKNRILQPLEVE